MKKSHAHRRPLPRRLGRSFRGSFRRGLRNGVRLGFAPLGLGCAALALGALACSDPESTNTPETPPLSEAERQAVMEDLETWRAERHDSLTRPGSWLTLAGLHWLEEGDQAIGRGAEIDLPAPAPDRVGVLSLAEGEVTFTAAPDARVTSAFGDPATPLPTGEPVGLSTDAEGAPTRLAVGPVSFHLIDRGGRIGVRVKNEESDVLRDFHGIDHFPADLDWRIVAAWEPYPAGKTLDVPSVLGGTTEESIPGFVQFTRDGETYRLDALEGGDEREIFVLFGDDTNGDGSYGGGRFLYATVDGPLEAPGTVTLDFNRAYNPPCAFTPFATCPLPPPSNVLTARIEAGEKSYGDH